MVLYRALSILLALIILMFGGMVAFFMPTHPAWATKVPRLRWPGIIIGTAVLAVCAYEGAAILPGTRWAGLFWALVPCTAIAAWFTLDFLMARALSGVVILLANYAIQHAFAYHCACRPLYAVVALAWGLVATACLAWPWWFRDILVKCAEQSSKALRYAILAVCVLSAVVLAILPFVGK
ncbi:MAG: hypothetical protein MJ106_07675 [Lentisphaeria bacterium]|nr:hypothetical protein [Lentisphaeria bacterium]